MAGAWVALASAVRTIAVADTGAGGLFETGSPLVTGFFSVQAPQGHPYPYIVMQQVADPVSDTFATEGADILFEFVVYAARFDSDDIAVDAIAERLKTLYRDQIVAVTGWSTATIQRTAGYAFQFVDEVIQKNEEYRAVFSR